MISRQDSFLSCKQDDLIRKRYDNLMLCMNALHYCGRRHFDQNWKFKWQCWLKWTSEIISFVMPVQCFVILFECSVTTGFFLFTVSFFCLMDTSSSIHSSSLVIFMCVTPSVLNSSDNLISPSVWWKSLQVRSQPSKKSWVHFPFSLPPSVIIFRSFLRLCLTSLKYERLSFQVMPRLSSGFAAVSLWSFPRFLFTSDIWINAAATNVTRAPQCLSWSSNAKTLSVA